MVNAELLKAFSSTYCSIKRMLFLTCLANKCMIDRANKYYAMVKEIAQTLGTSHNK